MANSSSQSHSVNLNDFDGADVIAFGITIHKVSNLRKVLNEVNRTELTNFLYKEFSSRLDVTDQSWVTPGIACDVLSVSGKGWKKGKLKVELVVKFYPDEPETEKVSQAQSALNAIDLMLDKLS